MDRPYKVKNGILVGIIATILSGGCALLYLPGSSVALVPVEWAMILGWFAIGGLFYGWAKFSYKNNFGEHVESIEDEDIKITEPVGV